MTSTKPHQLQLNEHGQLRHFLTTEGLSRELLTEITRPGLKDINVEFRGLRVARVYPETLPNIPAGSQQILIGRYLPEGRDQTGEVVIPANSDLVFEVELIDYKNAAELEQQRMMMEQMQRMQGGAPGANVPGTAAPGAPQP